MKYIICHEKTNYVGENMETPPPRRMRISKDAIPGTDGFICNCGRWTKTAIDLTGNLTHKIIEDDKI